ncbi:hypothetical protein Tdes44962_MAKER09378 [Teratosphaeria destructans]|uniref:Uncharacterized protein n=1 Tax=Teratosphaeria destructans TaxID=418781 RepID=A0A9W7ST89_9PEZI|nr:hypothetical protein Tdes44962_MAKER09378 [Teratosphaeria destructans]
MIRGPALVPLGLGQGVEVGEVGELGPAGVGDDAVEAAEGLDGGLDEVLAVGEDAGVALQHDDLDLAVFLPERFGEGQRRGFVGGVVDGEVAAFGGELLADDGSEAAGWGVSCVDGPWPAVVDSPRSASHEHVPALQAVRHLIIL